MREATVAQVREELEYLYYLAKSRKSEHISAYEHVALFFARAKLRAKSE